MRSKCLKIEPLEDRRMLAALFVSNLNDSGAGSLRDAIAQANLAGGADTVSFAANLSGGTINLTSGELVINEGLSIDARPLAANITINANQLSRIINITPIRDNFFLGGLTLKLGKTTASGSAGHGAAIRSNSREALIVSECEIVGNTVTGANSGGGGIFSRSILTLEDSTIDNNSTTGTRSVGAGIYALIGEVTVTRSIISGNSTEGDEAVGGGIWANDSLSLTDSTVTVNDTTGTLAHGGGIFANGTISLTRSTVSGNKTWASNSVGGGIRANGALSASQSTISYNQTSGATAHGAGIYTTSSVTLTRSTVTNNRLLVAGANGGGIYRLTANGDGSLTLDHSILAGNRSSNSEDNYAYLSSGLLKHNVGAANYSLIGNDMTVVSGTNNIVNNNPLLGRLAYNGGLTQTHAPLPGSPIINAGNPGLVVNPNEFDQRGAPKKRIVGGRIDIGALELQSADFDGDGDVDGRDFLRMQRSGIGSGADLTSWQIQYGTTPILSAVSAPLSVTTRSEEASDQLGAVAFLSTSDGEATGDEAAVIADDYRGEVDQAFAELGSSPRGAIREFGEIAVRRKAPVREAVSVEFASEI